MATTETQKNDQEQAQRLNFFGLLKKAVSEWIDDEASRSAASVAFYTMLSLAPLLVIAVAIAGAVLGPEAAEGQLYGQIKDLVGSEGAVAIQGMMRAAHKPSTGIFASILGFVTLVWGASAVVDELRASLNHIWKVKPKANGGVSALVRQRSRIFALVLGSGFLLLVSLLVSALLATLGKFVQQWLPVPEWATHVISFGISYVVIALLFAVLFKVIPQTKITWRDVGLGAAFTAFLFTLGKTLIGMYLGKASIASTYGAAGSLVIVLVWVYYSAQIFFFGAEFTKVFSASRGSRQGQEQQPEAKPEPTEKRSTGAEQIAAASGNAGLNAAYALDHAHLGSQDRKSVAASLAIIVGSLAGLGVTVVEAFRSGAKRQ